MGHPAGHGFVLDDVQGIRNVLRENIAEINFLRFAELVQLVRRRQRRGLRTLLCGEASKKHKME
jgi:hypothetical protein